MMRHTRMPLLLLFVIASGCADLPLRLPEPPTPAPPPEITPETYDRAEGSLWSGPQSQRFLSFESRARRVGDLITVEIEEAANAETEAITQLDRLTSYDVNVDSDASLQTLVTRPFINLLGFLGFSQQKTDKTPTANVELLNADSQSQFRGQGILEREATFTTTVACVVTEVSAAGLMRIEGQRHLTINRETQIIELAGWVRPQDVRIDNTVPSRLIASADIQYGGRGALSNRQVDPWLTRIFHWILPF